MLMPCEKYSVLSTEYPWSIVGVNTAAGEGTIGDDAVYRREPDPVVFNPTGYKTQRDVVHDEAVTVATVPFNPVPEDCCAKLGVDWIAVPGVLGGYTRGEKDAPVKDLLPEPERVNEDRLSASCGKMCV